MSVSQWKKLLLIASMSFTSGWVDVICMTRYEAMATMMTGNVLHLGRDLSKSGFRLSPETGLLPEFVFHLCTICAYILGLIVHQVMERRGQKKVATALAPGLALALVCVEIYEACFPAVIPCRWNCVLLAPIFAVQSNICIRGELGVVTSMATGHMHGLTNWFVQAIYGELSKENKKKVTVSVVIVFSLAAGAFVASVVVAALQDEACHKGEGCSQKARFLLLPVGPVLALTLLMHDYLLCPPKDDDQNKEDLKVLLSMTTSELLSPSHASGHHPPSDLPESVQRVVSRQLTDTEMATLPVSLASSMTGGVGDFAHVVPETPRLKPVEQVAIDPADSIADSPRIQIKRAPHAFVRFCPMWRSALWKL